MVRQLLWRHRIEPGEAAVECAKIELDRVEIAASVEKWQQSGSEVRINSSEVHQSSSGGSCEAQHSWHSPAATWIDFIIVSSRADRGLFRRATSGSNASSNACCNAQSDTAQ